MSSTSASNWRDLADAIIIQAASDYRKAQNRNSKRPHQADTLREIHSLEQFFLSKWFATLTTLDGRQLLHDLKKDIGLEDID